MRWREEARQWAHADSANAEFLLRKPQPVFRVEKQSLENALTALGRTWGVGTMLDRWLADKLRASPLISLEMHNATGVEALAAMIKEINRANDASATPLLLPPLRWGIDRGLVVVVNRADLTEPMLKIRTYDLRGWFARNDADKAGIDHTRLGDDVVRFIMQAVDPPSWQVFGNVRPSCQMINDYLVVTQTYENQERVARALVELRKSLRTEQMSATAPTTNPTTLPATAPSPPDIP
jgi:hypothetical protein